MLAWIGIGCESVYPEVVILNKTDEHILLKDISFNGCIWSGVLEYDEATSPMRCLPGEDRVHFKKLDTYDYCRQQAEDGVMTTLCLCDTDTEFSAEDHDTDEGLINEIPNWYNYQTLSVKKVDFGEFYLFEIKQNDMEQDFSAPGPFGH